MYRLVCVVQNLNTWSIACYALYRWISQIWDKNLRNNSWCCFVNFVANLTYISSFHLQNLCFRCIAHSFSFSTGRILDRQMCIKLDPSAAFWVGSVSIWERPACDGRGVCTGHQAGQKVHQHHWKHFGRNLLWRRLSRQFAARSDNQLCSQQHCCS